VPCTTSGCVSPPGTRWLHWDTLTYTSDRLLWATSDAMCIGLLPADAVAGTLVSSAAQPRKSAAVARWRPSMTGHWGMCPRLGGRGRDGGPVALAACHA